MRTASCLTCRFIDLDAIHGYTALHIAASHGHLETTKVLLRSGASLTSECQANPRSGATAGPARGRAYIARSTPLHIAAARRNVQMCRAMLQAHVSPCSIAMTSLVDCKWSCNASWKEHESTGMLMCGDTLLLVPHHHSTSKRLLGWEAWHRQ